MIQNLSAMPQLELTHWLRAWSVKPPEPRPETAPVLVLAFGLVRSAAMLDLTMGSLERYAPAGAALVVRAYASAAVFGAAHARRRERERERTRESERVRGRRRDR